MKINKIFLIVIGLALVCASGAFAASKYLITSTNQIKPSVLTQIAKQA